MASKYSVDEQRLRELHAKGFGNSSIAKELDVPHWWIARHLVDYGLTTNIKRGRPPEAVDELHSLCSRCGLTVPNSNFPWVKSSLDGRRLSYCRKCRSQDARERLGSNPETYWKDKTRRTEVRSKKLGLDFDLGDNYLFKLWEEQQGKCFYSGQEMVYGYSKGRDWRNPSVDKVYPSRGYTEGNIVICCNRANTMKGDMDPIELESWVPAWTAKLREAGLVDEVVKES